MTATIRWDAEITAVSSIAHGGQQLGTTTLLRREKVLLSDGRIELVPVVSGNTGPRPAAGIVARPAAPSSVVDDAQHR